MFSHVTVGVNDLPGALAFYGPFCAALGLVPKFVDPDGAGWMHPAADRPLFVVTLPFDGQAASPGNGAMVAFLAASRAQVESTYQLACALGATDEGAPGLRPQYHANYYGAYLRDPEGNKLCIVCHLPEDRPAEA